MRRHRRRIVVVTCGAALALWVAAADLDWHTGPRSGPGDAAIFGVSTRTALAQDRSSKDPYATPFESAATGKRGFGIFFNSPQWVDLPPANERNGVVWWRDVAESVRRRALDAGSVSNIRRSDYAGAESCRDCHEQNYAQWSEHAHRWMNAMATPETVKGDFSGGKNAFISYMGGRATFHRHGKAYRMTLVKGDLRRVYEISRTIGSRFYQYYVGLQVEGPEPRDHAMWSVDHVLPFGYWLDKKRWVPLVHVDGHIGPDRLRDDPFVEPCKVIYDIGCSSCHTTQPAGDWLLRRHGTARTQAHAPHDISFFASGYLHSEHPQLLERVVTDKTSREPKDAREAQAVMVEIGSLPAEEYAVNLGISCEACHNGARYHVEDSERMPYFFPAGTHVFASGKNRDAVWGHTSRNVNWTCARCHAGARPQFAAGIDTWNSTEFSDASRGHCYDPEKAESMAMEHLTCVHCHNPHKTIGKEWSRTPEEDDASCIHCHDQFTDTTILMEHTHHKLESEGSRCMNCHMPKINEGLQDVVRTHRIFNPTNAAMIEANQPNACNLCHLDKPINWTLSHLKEWYGKEYDREKIAKNYLLPNAPVGVNWVESRHAPTRLAVINAFATAKPAFALFGLTELLDDPELINRQMAQRAIEDKLGIPLEKHFGYRFYMMADEREGPIVTFKKEVYRRARARQREEQTKEQ